MRLCLLDYAAMFKWPGTDKVIEQAFRLATSANVEGAVELLREGIGVGDTNGNRSEALGMILYQAGRYAEAAEALERAAQRSPANMMRVYYLASALSRSGQLERALSMLSQVASANPYDAAPIAAQCLILAERADFPAARSAWNRAREIFASNPSQDSFAMGLLEQCSELELPQPDTR